MATASLVLGIISVVFSMPIGIIGYGWVGLLTGVAAIVLSALGMKKAKEEGTKSGAATAGLVLGIIGTVLSGIVWASCAFCARYINSDDFKELMNKADFNELLDQFNKLNNGN